MGFPPVYRMMGAPSKRELLWIIPFIVLVWIFLVIFIATRADVFIALAGVFAICCAIRVRMFLADGRNVPSLVPFSVVSLGRMAAFDIWTVGGAILFGLLFS